MPDLRGSILLGRRSESIPMAAAAPPAPSAPVSELGHSKSGDAWWWSEEESTPELRWPESLAVYDRMRRQDAQVRSVLRAVSLPIRRTPWRLDPNGARDEVVQQLAEDLGLPITSGGQTTMPRARDRFSWAEHLGWALLETVYGAMPFEQIYRLDAAGRTRLRKLGPRWPRTIMEWLVADDGGLAGIKQRPAKSGSDPVVIPVNRLVVYVHEREGDWRGNSLLRPAYKFWLLKDRVMRVQAQTVDRNGMGVPVYIGADGASREDLVKGQALAQAYRSGDNSGLAVPFGGDFRLRGVEGQLPDADKPIRYYDEQIGRAVLAHFLNLGQQTGSWALGSTFADFFVMSLQALAGQIADVANQHIVEDLVDANWGPDEPAPRITFDEIGSRQAATADALKTLVDAGIVLPDRVLEETVRQGFGLPAKPPAPPAPTDPGAAA